MRGTMWRYQTDGHLAGGQTWGGVNLVFRSLAQQASVAKTQDGRYETKGRQI